MPRKFTPEERIAAFWSKVDRGAGPDKCWPWLAHGLPKGYGKVRDGSRKMELAHRFAYRLTFGDPGSLYVLHRCDNPPCCNPAHLFLGTNDDNMADMAAKGRSCSGDRNGSRRHPERQPRGRTHGRAKLTEIDVVEIRNQKRNGVHYTAIAAAFGISPMHVYSVCSGRSWSHLETP